MNTEKIAHRVCPYCKRDNKTGLPIRISRGQWRVKKCSNCGFVYLENARIYEILSDELAWESTSKIEAERRWREQPVLQRLSKLTRFRLHLLPRKKIPDLLERYTPSGRVLDVGCGDGWHLTNLSERFRPCGVEISRELARRANEALQPKGGFAVHAPALEGLKSLPDRYFSAVCMRSFLEHEINPFEVLQESFRILGIGAFLIVKVPNFGSLNALIMGRNWCGVRLPDHVNYFTPRHLKTMVTNAEFAIHRFGWLRFRQPTADNMWLIARRER